MTRGRPKRDYDAEKKKALETLLSWKHGLEGDGDDFDVESYFHSLTNDRPAQPRRTSESENDTV